MTHHTQREVLGPLIGFAVLLAATGCATTSDLDKLEHNLAQKVDAQTRAFRSAVATIRDQVKGIKAEVEGLRAQIRTFQMDMRAALEDEKKTNAMRDQILKDRDSRHDWHEKGGGRLSDRRARRAQEA